MEINSFRLSGLFINTSEAKCSIYESGKMCFECLKYSQKYLIDYIEVDKSNRIVPENYDFYIFNYHIITMGWLDTNKLNKINRFKAAIVLEVSPNNPFVMCPSNIFDAYLVLDPTIHLINSKVYAFPRPLELYDKKLPEYIDNVVPRIGTFGFATKGKGFELVISAVSKEFEHAIVNINIPKGDYVSDNSYDKLISKLENYERNSSVKINITSNYFSKNELIEWCALNTLNVFLYTRTIPGLSATTDQAIVSERPLAVSTNPTFRHIHRYLEPYPYSSLIDSINNSEKQVKEMKSAWNPIHFAEKFDEVLEKNNVYPQKVSNHIIHLPIKEHREILNKIKIKDFIPPVIGKARLKLGRLLNKDLNQDADNNGIRTLTPFVHYAINSYSQFNEDLIIDLLLGKASGFYVDIGANDPIYNSNTFRFYNRGWSGLNVEPNKFIFSKLKESRTKDINLNVAISDIVGEAKFYCLGNDPSLSTLDLNMAKNMSRLHKLEIVESSIEVNTLRNIFETYLNDKLIDYMTMDVEGHEIAALNGNDWTKYRPTIILIESNTNFESVYEFMEDHDYFHLYNNSFNVIFADKRSKNNSLIGQFNWKYNRS